jgi:tripartite-type tricarboxylate transporter receptor subunit TctC
MEQIPDVATAAEQGFKGIEVGSWVSLFAPAGTLPDVVQSIQQYVAQVLADPQVRPWLLSTSQTPVGNPPAEFAAQYKADIDRYAKAIELAKIPKQE